MSPDQTDIFKLPHDTFHEITKLYGDIDKDRLPLSLSKHFDELVHSNVLRYPNGRPNTHRGLDLHTFHWLVHELSIICLNDKIQDESDSLKLTKILVLLQKSKTDLIYSEVLECRKIIKEKAEKLERENNLVGIKIEDLYEDYSNKISSKTEEIESRIQEKVEKLERENNLVGKNIEDLYEDYSNKISSKTEEVESRIQEEVNKFEQKRVLFEQLLAELGPVTEGEHAIKQANSEKKYAIILQSAGIFSLFFAVFILFYIFVHISFDSGFTIEFRRLTIEELLVRLMSSVIFLSPSIYLLKESSTHRAKENIYRQKGLHLRSIHAYLSDLPDKEKATIKYELSKSLFSIHNDQTSTKNVPDFLRDMKEVIGIVRTINGQQNSIREKLGRKPHR